MLLLLTESDWGGWPQEPLDRPGGEPPEVEPLDQLVQRWESGEWAGAEEAQEGEIWI